MQAELGKANHHDIEGVHGLPHHLRKLIREYASNHSGTIPFFLTRDQIEKIFDINGWIISWTEHGMSLKRKELSEERRRELRQAIADMEDANDAFYALATRTRVHPFIEFCGVMGEYIKICKHSLENNIDFTETTRHNESARKLMETYHATYLGEKLGCIFGHSMTKPKLWKAFSEEFFSDAGGVPGVEQVVNADQVQV